MPPRRQDDRRRMSTPPPRDGSYAPRPYDARRPYGNDRRVSPPRHGGGYHQRETVDLRDPQFNARSVLAQNLVDRGRALGEGLDRYRPSGNGAFVSGRECFSRAIRAAEIPPNFILAAGVSKFTSDSKPETWLEDYRVAVQIGGGNVYVAMKHLPLMLEGSAWAWLNQLTPASIYCWEDLARVFV
jgi:hypothetical protein